MDYRAAPAGSDGMMTRTAVKIKAGSYQRSGNGLRNPNMS